MLVWFFSLVLFPAKSCIIPLKLLAKILVSYNLWQQSTFLLIAFCSLQLIMSVRFTLMNDSTLPASINLGVLFVFVTTLYIFRPYSKIKGHQDSALCLWDFFKSWLHSLMSDHGARQLEVCLLSEYRVFCSLTRLYFAKESSVIALFVHIGCAICVFLLENSYVVVFILCSKNLRLPTCKIVSLYWLLTKIETFVYADHVCFKVVFVPDDIVLKNYFHLK